MTIQTARDGTVTVLSLQGALDTKSAGTFRETALEVLRGGARRVLVDMARVDQVDGFGLSALVSFYRKLVVDNQGLLALSGLNPETRTFFEQASLARIFPICYDQPEGLRELKR